MLLGYYQYVALNQVTDPTKKLGEFEDVSKVEKYELSEEEYSKRTDSVRLVPRLNILPIIDLSR